MVGKYAYDHFLYPISSRFLHAFGTRWHNATIFSRKFDCLHLFCIFSKIAYILSYYILTPIVGLWIYGGNKARESCVGRLSRESCVGRLFKW